MERSSACAAALCAVLLVMLGVAWGQDQRESCTWETAERLTVRGIDGAETALRGRCVRVHAELDGWKLSDARTHRGLRATQTDFIGAYSRNDTLLDEFGERPRRVEVLGVVGHCGDICADSNTRDAEGNVFICMASGFCHYYYDPYIMIEAVR